MSLIAELKRRNVIRMAGLYLVGAWLITQVAATVLPLFGAPDWIARSVIVVLAIGFIPALVVTWVFELTPDGLKRDEDIPAAQSIAPQTARTMNRLIIAGLALVIIVMAVERLWFAPQAVTKTQNIAARPDVATSINSIAVLPFQGTKADADTEYLSDGLTESLIFRLAQLPNLKVSPSSSIFRYKGMQIEPAKVGTELGVRAVISGRLTQRGDDLSISVEMIDVSNNTLLWGNQYNRKMSELLTTQREIALAIASKLQLKLSGQQSRVLTKRYTKSNEAYRLYLQGRYYFAKRNKDDITRGIDFFKQATQLDPNFALAYSNVAESYTVMPSHAYLSPMAAMPPAKAAAQQALSIDPSLADAHMAMANILSAYERKWQDAEREFRISFELNPNVSTTYFRYGQHLAALGQLEESIESMQQAVALEPLSLNISANLAMVHLYAGHNQQGLELAKSTHDLDPGFAPGLIALGIAYNSNGLYDDAIRLSENVLATDPTNQHSLMSAGYAYAKSGRKRDAEAIIQRFSAIAKQQYAVSFFVATVYAALGDKDKAFEALDQSFEQRDWWLTRLKVDPLMDSLRDDPRFATMLKRLNLPE